MTPTEIIDALIAAGTPTMLVVEIAQKFEQLKFDDQRRAKNAERMRTVRARASTCASVQHSAAQDSAYIESKEVSKKKKKVYIPDNFQPNEASRRIAGELGFTPSREAYELERFKASAKAHSRTYADWDAAWQSWMRSPLQSQNGHANGHVRKTTRDVGEGLAAKLRARENDSVGSSGGSDPNAVGLSGSQRDMFGRIPGDAGGNAVPVPAGGSNRGDVADPWSSEGMQIIPPNGRSGF